MYFTFGYFGETEISHCSPVGAHVAAGLLRVLHDHAGPISTCITQTLNTMHGGTIACLSEFEADS